MHVNIFPLTFSMNVDILGDDDLESVEDNR